MYIIIKNLSEFMAGLRAGNAKYGYVEESVIVDGSAIYTTREFAQKAADELQSYYPHDTFSVKELV